MSNKQEFEKLKAEKDKYQERVANEVSQKGERRRDFSLDCGIPIRSSYTPFDLKRPEVSFPGMYPYTSGIDPLGYRSAFWTIGTNSGYATAVESNERFKRLIESGATYLSVILDLPTHIGYDSDHPLAEGEVGKTGIPFCTVKDMLDLFEGAPVEKLRMIACHTNVTVPILAAMFIVMLEEHKIEPSSFSIRLHNDPLPQFVVRGHYSIPPDGAMRLHGDVTEYCAKNLPAWVPITVCGAHFREAGSTIIQQVAFILADAMAYIGEGLGRGLKVDDFMRNVYTFVYVHRNLFEEVAGLRALRKVWAKIMKERFGAEDEETCKCKILAQLGGSTLTLQQPLNNIVRITTEILACVLGGVQSVNTSTYDEAYALPTEESAILGIRAQQIVAHESGVADVVDPLAGSYFVESLTHDMEEKVFKLIEKIESRGGAVEAVKNGFYHKEVAAASYELQKKIESKERIIVGLNEYRSKEEPLPFEPFVVNPKAEAEQIERLNQVRRRRDNRKVKDCLNRIREAVESDENVMPSIIEGVRAYASLGEIAKVFRDVYGEYTPHIGI